jgi:hypothetical protein
MSGIRNTGSVSGSVAHVAHRAHVEAEGEDERGEDHDGDERRGNGLRDQREEVDDGETGRDEGEGQPGDGARIELGELGEEDQDGERVHEPRHDGLRHVAHDEAELQDPGHDLEKPREDRRRKQVFKPVVAHERDHQHRRRGGRGRDHPRPPAGDRRDDGDREAGVEPDLRIDARYDREGDGLGDERQRDDETSENVAADVAKPLFAIRFK